MIPEIRHARRKGRSCTHRRYRMTCEEYDELRDRAEGKCELCGIPEGDTPQKVLFIDHDPAVGDHAVRGLLCNRCNSGLHLPGRVEAAAEYSANPWYKLSPLRAERLRIEAARRAVRDELLAKLDATTAEYREATERLNAAKAQLRSARAAAVATS